MTNQLKGLLSNILGVSPKSAANGWHNPRVFSTLVWIAHNFEVATIFIDLVIFRIFLTLFIGFLTPQETSRVETYNTETKGKKHKSNA